MRKIQKKYRITKENTMEILGINGETIKFNEHELIIIKKNLKEQHYDASELLFPYGIKLGLFDTCGIDIIYKKKKHILLQVKKDNLKEFEDFVCNLKIVSSKALKKKIREEISCSKNIHYSSDLEEKRKVNEFTGVYRKTLLHGIQEVYCPRCGSENCSHFQEQKIIPGKTKTTYSANLNPLKPFTLINKNEKIIKEEKIVKEKKFMCNKCGKIFW